MFHQSLQYHYSEYTQASRVAHPFCRTKHFWAVGPPLSPSAGLSLSAPIANIYRSSSALSQVDRTSSCDKCESRP
jgi:hypothetical protein